jgi:hypothetical protein
MYEPDDDPELADERAREERLVDWLRVMSRETEIRAENAYWFPIEAAAELLGFVLDRVPDDGARYWALYEANRHLKDFSCKLVPPDWWDEPPELEETD